MDRNVLTAKAPRVLRIGLVLGGKLVEERLIRKRETVTIGQSSKATFAVPIPELPKKLALFELTETGYALHMPAAMDGRISDGDRVFTLAELRQSGAARQLPSGQSALPLSDHSRGKVTLGDLTLLFQLVAAPAPIARAQLPASVRGGRRIDPYLAGTVLLSAALHVGFMLYAKSAESDKPPQISVVAYDDRFVQPVVRLKPPTLPEIVKQAPGITAPNLPPSDPIGHEAPTHQPRTPHETPNAPESDADRKARVSNAVAGNVVLDVLGRRTRSGQGILPPGSDRSSDIDVQKAIDAAKAQQKGWSTTAERGGDVTTQVADGKHIHIDGPTGPAEIAKAPERKIPVVVPGRPIPEDPANAPYAGLVASKIRSSYLGGITQCYDEGIKQHGGMAGRIELSIEIGPLGTVTHASIDSSELDDPRSERCMSSLARGWSFARPPGGDAVTITNPFVFHAPK